MRIARLILGALSLQILAGAANEPPSAATLSTALSDISIDPNETYYVRDLHIKRGDIDFYLTEGVLSFATPVMGRCVAAVFITNGVEAGDAEIIAMPPRRSERASLVSFTKSPNLDEHFESATFVFSDNTVREIMAQLSDRPLRKAPDAAARLKTMADPILRDVTSRLDLWLVRALLDAHTPEDGFLYALIGTPELGRFAVLYEPTGFEPISIGQPGTPGDSGNRFKLWTAFRPRHAPAYVPPSPRVHNYHIETSILPDLSMEVDARFDMNALATDGRVLPFELSDQLRVISASVDGEPAEIMQRAGFGPDGKPAGSFLLITTGPLSTTLIHQIVVHYRGSVIRQTAAGAYSVDERNAWYPQSGPTLANFDLLFRCPKNLRLVSTGEPVSEADDGNMRVVHRRTRIPETMAGFNLGNYEVKTTETDGYQVECYAVQSLPEGLKTIGAETSEILSFYTQRWGALPFRSIAVSPVPGYFGQGFPGLIYLSAIAYMRPEDRPLTVRNSQLDTLFSKLLLPHEVAHQWWGNILAPADYRTSWLIEAMANDSALQFLQDKEGAAGVNFVLDHYRQDLTQTRNGHEVEEAGPVDFGFRLAENHDSFTWHTITYGKGTWILRMLRERLGNEAFVKMQVQILRDFASKPISNEDFRKLASQFVPPGAPDRDLSLFFDTWVYGTGIPALRLNHQGRSLALDVSGTDEDFTVDVPLRCHNGGREQTKFVRVTFGTQPVLESNKMSSCELPSASDFLYNSPTFQQP